MDPSLYISRFAALLEFQDETQKVAHDATRLVQRFSRDWMDTGRRPAGICGACLLLAARMNNFRRSVEEIVQVVKIADTTLKKRLDEFKATASGGLSIAEFRSMWLEETHDPPAYTQSVKKLRKMKRSESELLEDGDEAAETSSQGAERSRSRSTSAAPAGGSSSSSSRKGKGKEVVRAGGLSTLAEEGDGASSFAGSPGPGRGRDDAVFQAAADFDAGDSALLDDDEDGLIDPLLRRGSPAVANARLMLPPPPQRSSSVAGSVRGEGEGAADDDLEKDGVEKADQGEDDVDAEGGAEKPDGAFDAAISGELSSYLATSQAQQLSTELTEVERRREERRLNAGGDLDLDDLDEEELDGLLLTEHEVQIKTRLWMEYNKDYLEKLARAPPPAPSLRSPFAVAALLTLPTPPGPPSVKEAKAHGEAANGPKKARKKRSSANPRGTTPAESAKNLVQKKFSRKINYKSIESLFDNSDLPQKMSEHQLRGSEAPSGYGSDDDDEGDGKEKADRESPLWPLARCFGRKHLTPSCFSCPATGNEDDDDHTMAVVEEESDDEVRPSPACLLVPNEDLTATPRSFHPPQPAARASKKRPRHDDGLDDDDRAATRSRKPGTADEPDLAGLYDRGGSDDEGFEEV